MLERQTLSPKKPGHGHKGVVDVVLGAQWGDEGKGKLVSLPWEGGGRGGLTDGRGGGYDVGGGGWCWRRWWWWWWWWCRVVVVMMWGGGGGRLVFNFVSPPCMLLLGQRHRKKCAIKMYENAVSPPHVFVVLDTKPA